MSKHTPGPWIATDDYQVITDWPKVGFLTTIANCRIGGGGEEEWIANAHIIAAAPDLLAACKELVTRCGPRSADGQRARAAIAKAEGRS